MTDSLSLPLDRPLWEAFAQACARGLSAKAAATGLFARPDRGAKLMKRPEVTQRIRAIVESRRRGGSSDVGGLIDRLIDLADSAAAKDPDARKLDVARAALEGAGRLKQLMPPEPAPVRPPKKPLSLDEWRQKHDPTLPGSDAWVRAQVNTPGGAPAP